MLISRWGLSRLLLESAFGNHLQGCYVTNNFFAVIASFGGDMAILERAGSKVGLTWEIFIES